MLERIYKHAGNPLATRILERSGTAPAMIFLHGLADCADVWRPTIRLLGATRRLIAMDLLGHGGSSHVADGGYSLPLFVEAANEGLAASDSGPFILVGHSMGGEVALWLHAGAPQRTCDVALIDFVVQPCALVVLTVRAALSEMFRPYAEPRRYADILHSRLPNARPDVLRDYAKQCLAVARDGQWQLRADQAVLVLKDLPASNTESGAMAMIRDLDCPLAIVRGEYSGTLSATDARAMLDASCAPDELVVAQRAGHHVPLDAPADLAAALEALASRLTAYRQGDASGERRA